MTFRNKTGFYEPVDRSLLFELLKKEVRPDGKLETPVAFRQFVPFQKTENAEKQDDVFSFVFSSFALDRAGERIDCNGWELEQYLENPVVLWAHNSDIPAIGYAENLICNTDLRGDVRFNPKEIDEFGWSIGQRIKFGSIKCGSVGFLVKELEFLEDEKNEERSVIFRKMELLEFSICNVPANPEAHILNADKAEKKNEGFDLLKTMFHF